MMSSRSFGRLVVDPPAAETGEVAVADLGADGHAALGRPPAQPGAS
jgi:hypothetical protein